MTEQKEVQSATPWHRSVSQGLKKAALGVLFTVILAIPKLRRLRRRIWEWSAIRVLAALAGCVLAWRYQHAHGSAVGLVGGLVLMAIGLLIRAKPEAKSAEAQARELNALVVLNGGTFTPEGKDKIACEASLLVNPEWLFVVDGREQVRAEIPLTGVRSLAARPVPKEEGRNGATWELELTWQAGGTQTARFLYDGFFAEHLARVAESTLRNLLRKDLPVLPS